LGGVLILASTKVTIENENKFSVTDFERTLFIQGETMEVASWIKEITKVIREWQKEISENVNDILLNLTAPSLPFINPQSNNYEAFLSGDEIIQDYSESDGTFIYSGIPKHSQ